MLAESSRVTWIRANYWLVVAYASCGALALRMVVWIRQGSVMQYADYWTTFDDTITPGGGIRLSALWHFQGAQLISLPQIFYWLNMRFSGGSNITLGYFVVALAVGQIVILWSWIQAGSTMPQALRAALAAAAAALIFARHGVWNFLIGMSGTAWLSANLFAIAAITMAVRRRTVLAICLAALATVTYGTGVFVWPSILVAAALSQRKLRPILTVTSIGVPVTIGFFVLRSSQPTEYIPNSGPFVVLKGLSVLLGGLFLRDAASARILGTGILVVTTALAAYLVLVRSKEVIPWIALAVYSVGAAASIGYGRVLFTQKDVFLASRYSSIAALFWLASLALCVVALRRLRSSESIAAGLSAVAFVAIAAVIAVATFGDLGSARWIRDKRASQEQLADSLRLGVAGGGNWLFFEPFPEITQRLSAIGHYPFNADYDGGCGLLGKYLELPEKDAPPEFKGKFGVISNESSIAMLGWVEQGEGEFDCGVVTNARGLAIGVIRGGDYVTLVGFAPPGSTGISGISRQVEGPLFAYVKFKHSSTLRRMPVGGTNK